MDFDREIVDALPTIAWRARPGGENEFLNQRWHDYTGLPLAEGLGSGWKNAYDCIKVFSETDQTEDLKAFDMPTLIVHGDDDQIVPIGASALAAHQSWARSVTSALSSTATTTM